MMLQIAGGLGAKATFGSTSLLAEGLLQTDCEFLQLLVARVEFLLDLLDFSLEADILITGDVIRDLKVSIVILEIFLLHLHEIVETLGLRVRLRAKNHFTKLLPLKLVDLGRESDTPGGPWLTVVRKDGRNQVSAHGHLRLDVAHGSWLLDGHPAHNLLVTPSVLEVGLVHEVIVHSILPGELAAHGLLLLLLRVSHLLLLLLLGHLSPHVHHVGVRILELLVAEPFLQRGSSGALARHGSLALAICGLTVLDLLGLRAVFLVDVILVVDDQDGLVVHLLFVDLLLGSLLGSDIHDLLVHFFFLFFFLHSFFFVFFFFARLNLLLVVFLLAGRLFLLVDRGIDVYVSDEAGSIVFFVVIVRECIVIGHFLGGQT
mmetsp:Transcript_2459/g.3758  ORF Transcript_2459/g.3758 Transcript_2459/m.3758 type:complete len:374 (-) Transcript_2459:201-1322(-)